MTLNFRNLVAQLQDALKHIPRDELSIVKNGRGVRGTRFLFKSDKRQFYATSGFPR